MTVTPIITVTPHFEVTIETCLLVVVIAFLFPCFEAILVSLSGNNHIWICPQSYVLRDIFPSGGRSTQILK